MNADIIEWSDHGRKRRLAESLAQAKTLEGEIEQLLSGGKAASGIPGVLRGIETLTKRLTGIEHLLLDDDSRRVLRTTREALDAMVARARQILEKRDAP